MRRGAIAAGVGIAAIVAVAAAVLTRPPRTWDVPEPAIAANESPEAIARGEEIFSAACVECHLDPATGKALRAANLTAHADGLADVNSGTLARLVRTGVRPDGRLASGMPAFPRMGDADLAALLGFVRSPSSLFEATAGAVPRSPGARGKPADAPPSLASPALRETLAYGEYLAEIFRCRDCHTREGGEAFAGGRAFAVSGGAIASTNLTPSKTRGIGEWTVGDLTHALRDGISKDGGILRYPMPRLRRTTDEEIAALYAFLVTQPPREEPPPAIAGLVPREKGMLAGANPEQLFLRLGCPSCHAKGAPYALKIRRAKGKTPAEVAAWIRNPQARAPGTPMPTFATLVDDEQATALATWVLARVETGEPF
jgi:mono/diheme cytochrome c family protein